MKLVDAHVHLWDNDAVPLSWFRDDFGLDRVRRATDFAIARGRAPVAGAVAVQAADSLAEARWLLTETEGDESAGGPEWGVVVQYAAVGSPGSWAGLMQPALADARVRGVRVAAPSAAGDLSDVPALEELARGLSRTRLVLEFLVRPDQLRAVGDLASRYPQLDIVVCHVGLGSREPDIAWTDGLRRLSRLTHVGAKLSGLHPESRSVASLRAIVSRALDAFGPERVMFGSDWPLSARALSYPELVDRVADALPPLEAEQADGFWAGNARRRYSANP